MATVIKSKSDTRVGGYRLYSDGVLEYVKRFFSYSLWADIDELVRRTQGSNERIEEIRIRSGGSVYITLGGRGIKRNVSLERTVSSDEVAEMLEQMCDGSLYAYKESIVNGYISLDKGVRVGVCGRASVEDGKILGVYNVSSLNIRLPCKVSAVDSNLVETVRRAVIRGEGVLIYSPPSQGKTTLLRSLSRELARGVSPMRVVLVDTRDEIGGLLGGEKLSLDVLFGYPKADGIRIATAFMNPQVIICDEIGMDDEASAIAQAQNCGVPLIASAHGSSAEKVLKRNGMRLLHEVGAFSLYVGIQISDGGKFEYRIQKAEEIELENTRDSFTVV